ncbi:diguanylate cyclase [Edaphobacter albus]|uniref:diguanylate cyclase n=1 Tax=Edaphobacter sp. 4G125 TaxID=2763071 RepID=UPI0016450CA6|nr:diguanylate cyclase [Edaphobacter sp. 4G125]QNI36411.1 diguanylate cyclase [Edaphobacter sp. 4G125]
MTPRYTLADISVSLTVGMPAFDNGQYKPVKMIGGLLLSALLTIGLICAGGYTVHLNMRATEAERGWTDHSQLVLTNLQTQAAYLDRIDFNLQLYAITNELSHLKTALSTLSAMNVSLVQLQGMVSDNESQSRYAEQFDKDLQSLTTAVSRMDTQNRTPQAKQLLDIRNDLGILQQQERDLLRVRADLLKKGFYRNVALSAGYLSLSLLIVVVLYIFLLRDALQRGESEKELFAAKSELESTVHKLTGRAEDSIFLTHARDELQLCTAARDAHESTVRHMNQLLPGTSGATLTINNSRRMVEIAARWGDPKNLLDGFDPDSCCGLRAGKLRWRKKGRSELHCAHFTGEAPEDYLCIPLAAHGETQGFLFLSCDTPDSIALVEERQPLIQELCELASLSIAGLNLRAKLEGQSIRDGLTGLFNRHFMEIALERELHRATRYNTQLAVLMTDVDHFKQFNDTFGHEAGDIVLRAVAECYRKMVRAEDIICRYGGEEFVVIMPDVSEESAVRRAEMLREAVSGIKTQFRGEPLRSISISGGLALYPSTAEQASDLIHAADNALYRAKHAGRDQIIIANEPVETI